MTTSATTPLLTELKKTQDPGHFVTCHLFDAVPHIFEGNVDLWRRWKATLAANLEVDAHSVMLVGSAALGVSLSPGKNLKAFDGASDVDAAVISHHHFERAWHTLRGMTKSKILRLSPPTQVDITEHAPNYVYFGSIATDRVLSLFSFGPQWADALEAARQLKPVDGRELKVRLYRDVDALRRYQIRSIRQTQKAVLQRKGAP
jgi:hypothetical protein